MSGISNYGYADIMPNRFLKKYALSMACQDYRIVNIFGQKKSLKIPQQMTSKTGPWEIPCG